MLNYHTNFVNFYIDTTEIEPSANILSVDPKIVSDTPIKTLEAKDTTQEPLNLNNDKQLIEDESTLVSNSEEETASPAENSEIKDTADSEEQNSGQLLFSSIEQSDNLPSEDSTKVYLDPAEYSIADSSAQLFESPTIAPEALIEPVSNLSIQEIKNNARKPLISPPPPPSPSGYNRLPHLRAKSVPSTALSTSNSSSPAGFFHPPETPNNEEPKTPPRGILKPAVQPASFSKRSSLLWKQQKDKLLGKMGLFGKGEEEIQTTTSTIADPTHPLHSKRLKRVRFSVPLLSTNYIVPNSCRVMIPAPENTKQYTHKDILNWYMSICYSVGELPNETLVKLFIEGVAQPSITHINLVGHPLTQMSLIPVIDIFPLLPQLTKLELDDCQLDDNCLKVLSNGLLIMDSVSYLSLANNPKVTLQGIQYLSIYLANTKRLLYLDFSFIQLNKSCVHYLFSSIKDQIPNSIGSPKNLNAKGLLDTESFSLELSDIFSTDKVETSPKLDFDPKKSNHTLGLKYLKLNRCSMRSTELAALSQSVHESHLQQLSLCENKIGILSADAISELIRPKYPNTPPNLSPGSPSAIEPKLANLMTPQALYSHLTHLDLSKNELKSDGLIKICENLKHNTQLKSLNLSQNGITELGFIKLCEALVIYL